MKFITAIILGGFLAFGLCGNAQSKFSKHLTEFSIVPDDTPAITIAQMISLDSMFCEAHPFNWKDKQNNCEDRANAVAMLLDKWGIPNYKIWLFGKSKIPNYTKGKLVDNWGYHVANVLQVKEVKRNSQANDSMNRKPILYVLDPNPNNNSLQTVENWLLSNTAEGTTCYLYSKSNIYMYHAKDILDTAKWETRSKKNFKYTMQGLAGYNGTKQWIRKTMCFRRKKINKNTEAYLFIPKPAFLPN